MRREIRLLGVLCAAMLFVSAFAGGCKKKDAAPPPTTTAAAAPKGPDYQEFAALPRAKAEMKLPWVMSEEADIEAAQCFKPVEAQPGEAGIEIKDLVDRNRAGIKKAIVEWLVEVVEPTGLTRGVTDSWDLELEDLVAMEVTPDQVRFGDDSECLGKTGWLSGDKHLITTAVGAKTIKFETTLPVGLNLAREIADAAKAKGVTVESEALFDYQPAKDDAGNPVLDSQQKPLYTSPSGSYISEKDVPTADQLKMKEWTFKMEAPLFFGVRELPKDAVRRESDKSKCDVVIIPDMEKPQPPDCAEYKESAFVVNVIEGEDKPVRLTIVTGDQNKGVNLDWKEATKLQLNDRIILWIQPEKVEVGVNLKLNSLVLNPLKMEEGEGGGGDDGYGEGGMYRAEPEKKADQGAKEDDGKGKGKKDKKKDKKGEEKKASGDALENYLNQ
jgi:hypothetical protein